MPFIETHDHTTLYYRRWGSGKPVIFVCSWALSGEMWEYQMLPLSAQGLSCIALDRRGHGRSDDPGTGYDFDTLADDLSALIEHLDLREVTLIGHSMGCAEIARYLSRHGAARINRVALVSPIRLVRAPEDDEVLFKQFGEIAINAMCADRPFYFTEGAIQFFGLGAKWPQPTAITSDLVQWGIRLILQTPLKVLVDCWYAMMETDFGSDVRNFTMPTLIIHGDSDYNAPLELCGQRIAQAVPHSQLLIYERAPHGLFLTERERLTRDMLAFIQGSP